MTSLTVTCDLRFNRGRRGQARVVEPAVEPGRVPRVARLMALALRLERYLRDGDLASQSQAAELGQVSRARISQIMNLLNLAPDIQEAILFLPRIQRGRAPVILRDLQPIALVPDWRKQRNLWRQLLPAAPNTPRS